MDGYKYKLVLFGKDIYREIALPDSGSLRIGTNSRCEVRLDRELFFDDFEISIGYVANAWVASCGPTVYFSDGSALKKVSSELKFGTKLEVKYRQGTAMTAFTIDYVIDFDQRTTTYDRVITIDNERRVLIGGKPGCDVFIADETLKTSCIVLERVNSGWQLTDGGNQYGIYINGARCTRFPAIIEGRSFFSLAGYTFYLKNNALYTTASDNITVSKLGCVDIKEAQSALQYPKIVLSTRVKMTMGEEEVTVLPPKAKEKPQRQNFLVTLLPTLGMGVMTVALRGVMGGGGNFVYYSIGMVGIGILTSVITFVSDRRRRKKEEIERQESYKKYIKEKEKQVARKHEHEMNVLNHTYRSMEEVIESVYNFDGELFDRRKDDSDFLDVCIGRGSVDSAIPIKYTAQETIDAQDELADLPEQLTNTSTQLDYAPIIIPLKTVGAVGVYGPDYQRMNLLKQITIEICTRQFYDDVSLYFFIDERNTTDITWIRWFKHVHNEQLGCNNIVCDEDSKKIHFEYLYEVLQSRATAASGNQKTAFGVHYVVLVYDNFGLYNHPLARYIDKAADYGFTFIFFERYKELLPSGCSTLIMYDEIEHKGRRIDASDGDNCAEFTYSELSSADAARVAKRLAPVYADEISLDNTLTKNVSFYELFKIYSARDLDIITRWRSTDVTKSMAAPLGVSAGGEVVALDIREHVHGPHGLVAGTTGYGKSEIVQSYVLSMATLYTPEEVGFIFVDFKGGGMAKLFKNLPHQVGIVTDIDGKEINRFLESLQAESRKRKRLFAECSGEVNHIDKYIVEYREGRAKVPLQHLILVVDEFAELKRSNKEFITQIISIAATGRSLGIHLILATQDPGNSVDDEIQINSTFTLCLKVKKPEDSKKVIKSPLAAEINEPGRAYLRVGDNGSLILFQSAYSGAPVDAGNTSDNQPFTINRVLFSGKRVPVYERKKQKSKSGKVTQLSELVDYIDEVADANNIHRLSQICLPPLPERIEYDERVIAERSPMNVCANIGVYDNPSEQYQGAYKLSLSSGNTFVLGSQMTGKTNLLQYIVRDVAQNYPAQEVTFYLIDNASGVLRNQSMFHNVGGVVTKNDDEGFKKLIDLLKLQMERRENMFAAANCDSFRSYVEDGGTDLPLIVVLIDNLVALKENREELYVGDLDEDLVYLLCNGVTMGITFVCTAPLCSHTLFRFMPNFSNHIALYCNDPGEYMNILGRTKLQPKNLPGRCLIELEQEVFECQLYSAYTSDIAKERTAELNGAVEASSAAFPMSKARPIPAVPEKVTQEFIDSILPSELSQSSVCVGVDYDSVNAAVVDLRSVGSFFICNPPLGAHGNEMLYSMVSQLIRKNTQFDLYVFDNYEMKGASLRELPCTKKYTHDCAEIVGVMKDIGKELESRAKLRYSGDTEQIDKLPLIVVAVQDNDCFAEIGLDMDCKDIFKALSKKYRGLGVCFIFSNVENEALQYTAPEPLKALRDARVGFTYLPVNEISFFDIDFNTKKLHRKPLGSGDCFWTTGPTAMKRIKTLLQ